LTQQDLRHATRLGPVRPAAGFRAALRPADRAEITGGFWRARREVVAQTCIPQGPALLETAGNLHNLRLVTGEAEGEYRGDFPFLDSDVYKWLEAAAWQAAEPGGLSEELTARLDEIVALVARAQQADGYLNTWFQIKHGGRRYEDLPWGHELYCAGHLIQAGIALRRATGRTDLLDVARRFADHLAGVFGPGNPVDGVDGHPEIETALVELYRETGDPRYRDLAGYFIDRRGHGLLNPPETRGQAPGPEYFQDHLPVRDAPTVTGHAVRQLYLLAGATDYASETDDRQLPEALERMWSAMTATKTHLTGGLGAHHAQEDFGDPYELPTERAYCETCAAVAGVHWSWRMALLTGRARYSDLIERILYNGLLAGMSLDGERWLYVNPLQVRDGYSRHVTGDQGARRTRWFRCACCPPNVMRLLASLPHYVASTDDRGLQLHQYADGTYGGARGAEGDRVAVRVETDYPWTGAITVTADETGAAPWTLSLRVPAWCDTYALRVAGEPADAKPDGHGWLRIHRAWTAGDAVELTLAIGPRLTRADPRVDAVRGCVAIERGPLVYCVEGVDHKGGLDDLVFDARRPLTERRESDLLGGVTVVTGAGRHRTEPNAAQRDSSGASGAGEWWPYRAAQAEDLNLPVDGEPITVTAIPYYAWANREDGPMRVWLPIQQPHTT
jgi:DUF1680 family protein